MDDADQIPLRNIPTKALVVDKPGAPFLLKDVILDEVRNDEVLVEMKYTGLCHTVGKAGLKTSFNLWSFRKVDDVCRT